MDDQWYAVGMFFRSVSGDSILWELVVVLVAAQDPEVAEATAVTGASDREISYEAVDGSAVAWKFMGTDEVQLLDSDAFNRDLSGTEVYSKFLSDEEAQSMRRPFPD